MVRRQAPQPRDLKDLDGTPLTGDRQPEKRAPRRLLSTAIFVVGALTAVVGAVALLMAWVTASGADAIPSGAEVVPWLVLPAMTLVAGVVLLRQGLREDGPAMRAEVAVGMVVVAVAAVVVWWVLADVFRHG